MSIKNLKNKLDQIRWWEPKSERILIVDNEIKMAQEVQRFLQADGFEVDIVTDGKQALENIEHRHPDLILSEISIRYMNGFHLCRLMKGDPATKHIPVILITGLQRPEDKIKGIEAGASDFVGKPFDELELKTRVKSTLKLKALHAQLENIDEIILAFSRAVEARDPYTRGHSERVGKFGIKFAAALGLDQVYQQILYKGAILHDIGKIGVRDAVLLKQGRLTPEEYKEIQKHPDIGVKICAGLKSSLPLMNIIAYHHERMDGMGYPYKLMGHEIPMEARIIAITDTFDALTSTRPYRNALSTEEACLILDKEMGTHFDEDLLPVFLEVARLGELQEVIDDVRKPAPQKPEAVEISKDILSAFDMFLNDVT